MNKVFLTCIVSSLIAGSAFTGCDSNAKNEQDAKEKVQDAKQDLKDVQDDTKADAYKAAITAEWIAFRKASDTVISKNEVRITELKNKIKKTNKIHVTFYTQSIDSLESKNTALRNKINMYESNQSDWEEFKREFNHDMNELSGALKDFTVDNKK